MSWIHLDDIAGIFLLALDNPAAVGPINGTSPNPVHHYDFGKALARVLKRLYLPIGPPRRVARRDPGRSRAGHHQGAEGVAREGVKPWLQVQASGDSRSAARAVFAPLPKWRAAYANRRTCGEGGSRSSLSETARPPGVPIRDAGDVRMAIRHPLQSPRDRERHRTRLLRGSTRIPQLADGLQISINEKLSLMSPSRRGTRRGGGHPRSVRSSC